MVSGDEGQANDLTQQPVVRTGFHHGAGVLWREVNLLKRGMDTKSILREDTPAMSFQSSKKR